MMPMDVMLVVIMMIMMIMMMMTSSCGADGDDYSKNDSLRWDWNSRKGSQMILTLEPHSHIQVSWVEGEQVPL